MSQRIALCLGYNGAGYFGLQRQPDNTGKPTIEQELERGLLEVGAMQHRNAGALHRVNWSRTSRTDKGVSAAANVVAFDVPHACLRAEQQQPQQQPQQQRAADSAGTSTSGSGGDGCGGDAGLAALVDRLNGAMKAPIRVWGGVRVGLSFDARRVACGRRYEYLLPLWALDPAVGKPRGVQPQPQQPPQQPPQQQPQQQQQQTKGPLQLQDTDAAGAAPPADAGATTTAAAAAPAPATDAAASTTSPTTTSPTTTTTTTTAERSRMRAEAEIRASSYSLTPTELKRLNLILGVFVGSHCFHNFTSEPCDDPESLRRTVHVARAEGPVYLPGPCGSAPTAQAEAEAEAEAAAAAAADAGARAAAGGAAQGGEQQPAGQAAAQGPQAAAQGSEPYVRIVFIGTGFLMHQIRRMVGLALAVARKAAPPDCIRAALDPARPHITPPTAPPTGLMMDRAYFSKESYETARAAAAASTVAVASSAAAGGVLGTPPLGTACAPSQKAAAQGNGINGGGGGGGGSSGGGDWRSRLEELSTSGEEFKGRELYAAVCGAGPVEMFQFLCGLTDSAFGFRSWAKRPLAAAAGAAPAPAAAAGVGAARAAGAGAAAVGKGGSASGGGSGAAAGAGAAAGGGVGAKPAAAAAAAAAATGDAGAGADAGTAAADGEGQPPHKLPRVE
ncbi:hypothetical protein HYH02_009538 [Chlamydomonas schloesseri]|uniref:Pseudouridine synthase I TruA alpha/beta domain-containing protein n=1 Tax=Chlamydomonas schloesseri TaxID=2026947 RepID=A0A835W776_9CHLO|nr:hypothetical protein HYH02_009538 [Chlamydomonas schloesseri]|eukprot:KAG2443127.1 hypothetical protein HYH02_009538 [Chlamydomonas schloesseri]